MAGADKDLPQKSSKTAIDAFVKQIRSTPVIKASGERATPAMVEKELARLERAQAALSAIEAVEKAGGTAHYHPVDLTDSAGLAAVMEQILTTSERIDVLPRVLVSGLLEAAHRDELVDLVCRTCRANRSGDGKIFFFEPARVIEY